MEFDFPTLQKNTGKKVAERNREAGDQIKQIRSNRANLPIKANMTSRVAVQRQRPGAEEEGPQTCWKRMWAPTCEFLPSPAWPCARKCHFFPPPSPLHGHAGRIRPGRKAGRSARRGWKSIYQGWQEEMLLQSPIVLGGIFSRKERKKKKKSGWSQAHEN